ncbi:MAG: enoyl-CoA hydratase/isomerase family protein [Planctomycetota bacterium]
MTDVRVELDEHVGVVSLSRPDVRNALTPEMLDALRSAPQQLIDRGARALLLVGDGRSFCAGFDLSLCQRDPSGGVMRALLTGLSESIVAWRAVRVPTVLCAHGAAIAGGAALLGAFDVVVSHNTAKVGYPVLKLGVSPAVSAPFMRLGAGDGPTRARLLEPELISGARAHEVGLVHELEPDAEAARARSMELARELAHKPPGAIAATKQLLDATTPIADQAADALDVSRSLTGGPEERERLAALPMRKP